jgi:flagellar hook-basal body protein
MGINNLLTGVSALKAQQKKMEVIGNNLANVNTTGFKKERVVFQDMFYNQMSAATGSDGNIGGIDPKMVGSGVSVASIDTVHTQGTREETGRYLDFFIEGKDFFVAENSTTGELMLSRNGAFQLDSEMNLVDSLGNKMMGFNVDPETGTSSDTAGYVKLPSGALAPRATSKITISQNIDSSSVENVADIDTNAWEVFSGGENFGSMTAAVTGASGSRTEYGSDYYTDSYLYEQTGMTLSNIDARFLAFDDTTLGEDGTFSDVSGNTLMDTLSFSSAESSFAVGDLVTLSQVVGSDVVQQEAIVSSTGSGLSFNFTTDLSSSFDSTASAITMSKSGETSDNLATLTTDNTLTVSNGTDFGEGQIVVITQSNGTTLVSEERTITGISGNVLSLDEDLSGYTTGTADVHVQDNYNKGFNVNDIIGALQGSGDSLNQERVTVTGVSGGVLVLGNNLSEFTDQTADITINNLTSGTSNQGSSDGGVHNDILRSQVSLVGQFGELIASFYRVSGSPSDYTQSTVTDVSGNSYFVGSGEFSNFTELVDLIEQALRDEDNTNNDGSQDLQIDLDKFGKVSFSGTGTVDDFRIVVNGDNEGMQQRFGDIAMVDNGDTALTQARFNENGDVIAAQTSTTLTSEGIASRTTNSTNAWYEAGAIENYGYSSSNPATGYGEFAGIRLDGGASGTAFGTMRLSLVNGLGESVTSDYSVVPRNADFSSKEFTTMGDLVNLIQTDLRNGKFSSIAEAGSLVADASALVSIEDGRISITTTNGSFNNLKVTALNDSLEDTTMITQTDEEVFGTVLGQLSSGINGKGGVSNKFIEADSFSQTVIYDSAGNQHTSKIHFVKDRTSGLSNLEYKFKASLNPNLNTFASDSDSALAYRNTFNSIENTLNSEGVLAFDLVTGGVLNSGDTATDSRYTDTANLSFIPQQDSVSASTMDIDLDFTGLTSYNGENTLVSLNEDGHAMGNLVRIVGEQNSGGISAVYSNGLVRTLAKVGLMSIANPEGMAKVGGNYFVQTSNSSDGGAKGLDQVFSVSAQAPAGIDTVMSKISSGALEGSNVDLTEELTNMITAQRSFSSAGKIITSADEMMSEVINLKR